MAAPTGKEGSAELVCQAALPGQGSWVRGRHWQAIEQQGDACSVALRLHIIDGSAGCQLGEAVQKLASPTRLMAANEVSVLRHFNIPPCWAVERVELLTRSPS